MKLTVQTFVVSLGLLSLVATSHSDPAETYEPQIIPACKVFTLKDGREVCGWLTLEDVKAAYTADADLVKCREDIATKTVEVEVLGVQAASALEALDAEQRTTSALKARNQELTTDLIEMNRKYELERAKPRFGSPIAWTTAAVLGAALVGVMGANLID